MTSADFEKPLISSVKQEIWRPFYALGALACAAALVGLPAAMAGSAIAIPVVLFWVTACLGLASTRTLVWRLFPARVTVSYDDSGLFVRRGAKLLAHYPWPGIQQVHLTWGDRWPEWSRWALFARISVVRDGDRGASIDTSPGILLVRPRDVENAQRSLDAVVDRYVDDSARR